MSAIRSEPWFVLPSAMAWFYARRHPEYSAVPSWRADCAPSDDHAPIDLIYPRPRSTVYVPTRLDGERSTLIFEAAHAEAGAELHWHLDGAYLSTTREIHQIGVSPPPGEHHLVLVDMDGARVERSFTVLDHAR